MSFLSSAVGGQSGFNAAPATGDAKFTNQIGLLPDIQQNKETFNDQLGSANTVNANQGNLAQQLNAQSQGQGPNIANLQLQQATDQNNKQAAGAIASQRGMNPALAARQIQMQAAANNQQAAGQSGVLRAQQQLASQGALANVYGQQANENLTGAQLANQQLGINQGALTAQNNAIVGANDNANQINANTAANNASAAQSAGGGFLGGVGSVLSSPIGQGLLAAGTGGASTAVTGAGNALGGADYASQLGQIGSGIKPYHEGGEVPSFLRGGSVESRVSPGEKVLSKKDAILAKAGKVNPMKVGKTVPGKAKVEGNSLENDTVPAQLHPGDAVLPRSVTKSEHPDEKAKNFMRALKEENAPGPKGYSKVLELKRKMKEIHGHINDLHDMMKEKQ